MAILRLQTALLIPLIVILRRLLPTSFVQIYLLAKSVIASLDLPQSLVEELVEAGDCGVLYVPGATCHKVELEWHFVSLVELGGSLIVSLEHLGNHYFG